MYKTHRRRDAAIVQTGRPASQDPDDGDDEANADYDQSDVVEEGLLGVGAVAGTQQPGEQDALAVGQEQGAQ